MTAPEASRPLYTGRQVVVLAPTSGKKNPAKTLESIAGFSNVARSKDFESQALEMAVANDADATVFDELGVAVVSADPDQRTALMAAAAEGSAILSVEPELIHYALTVARICPRLPRRCFGSLRAPQRWSTRGRQRRGRGTTGRQRRVHLGPAGHPRHDVATHRSRGPARGARHRLRPEPSGLRGPKGDCAVIRRR